MKKGLLNLILGASLALPVACSRQSQISEGDFKKFATSFKEYVYAKYEHIKEPSEKNKLKKENLYERCEKLGKKLKIKPKEMSMHYRKNGMYFVEHAENSYIAGKIAETKIVEGFPVHFIKTSSQLGIKPLGYFLGKTGIGGGCDYKNKEIMLDLDSIEMGALWVNLYWDKIEKNNEYFEKGNKRWKPWMQPFYNVLKDAPKLIPRLKSMQEYEEIIRSSEVMQKYEEEKVKASLAHELTHCKDSKNDSEIDREVRAYLEELKVSLICLGDLEKFASSCQNNNEEKEVRCEVTKRIFNGFMSFPDINSKRDFYRQSKEQIAEKADILKRHLYPK